LLELCLQFSDQRLELGLVKEPELVFGYALTAPAKAFALEQLDVLD